MPRVVAYGASSAALVAAVALRWLLDPLMGDTLPLVTLFGAVAIAVWAGGYRPAVVVAILGYLACYYQFIEARGQLVVDLVGLLAYLLTCFIIILFGEARRRAAEVLAEQSERLRVTFGSIGDAVITTDAEARVTYLTAVAESLTGWRQEEAKGHPIDDVFRIVNEKTREPAPNPVTRVLREGVIAGLANHTVLIRKDGTELPIDDTAAPIRSQAGELVGCVLVFRDITARRRSEQALRDSESRLKGIITSATDAIITLDSRQRIVLFNEAAERIFGCTATEVVGQPLDRFIPTAVRERHRDHVQEFGKATGTPRAMGAERVLSALRADGEEFPIEAHISKVTVGAETLYTVILRDIIERKRVEGERERLARMLDSGFDAVVIRDAEDRITSWNRGAAELYGWTQAEALGQVTHTLFQTKFPKPLDEIIADVLRNDRWEGELVQTRKDGTVMTVFSRWTLERDAQGRRRFILETNMDITARKQIEEALRFSEQRARAFLDNSAIIAWLKDEEGRNVFLSENYVRRLGLPDWKDKTDFELWPRDIAEGFRRNDLSVLAGDEPLECIEETRTPDGSVSFWLNSKFWFRDAGGKKFVGGVGVDITEWKRAESILAANLRAMQRVHGISTHFVRDRDLDSLLGEILDAVIETTRADFGNIQLVDPATGLLEIAVQRGFGHEFLDFFGGVRGDSACGTAKSTRSRVVVEDIHTDAIFRDPQTQAIMRSAGVRAVQSTPLMNRNGDLVGVLSTHFRAPHRPMDSDLRFVDVFAQQAADMIDYVRAERGREELLAIAERARADAETTAETLRRVQEIADPSIGDLPLDEFLHEVLLRVRDTVNCDVAVILAQKLEEEEEEELRVRAAVGLDEAVPENARIRIGEHFAGRIAKERRPLIWNDPDPELVWPLLRRRGVRALAGVPLMSGDRLLGVLYVGSIRRREFIADEVELLRLAGVRIALGMERAARRDAERRSREVAEASNRSKDEFLAMLGHELRNPLSAVRNAIATASLDESRRPRALEIARRQTDQLGRLVDDLLDVARITQGRITLRKERVPLSEVLERAVEGTRSFIESRGVELHVALSSDAMRVEADPARLEQVFVNLLTNAGKYTEAGGRIALTTQRRDDEVVVRVKDTGIGIAPEMLPRMWDLFSQADRSLNRAQGGLGIGLTVARRLVELHGARIEARSEGLGKGAEFVVTLRALPVATDEPSSGAIVQPVLDRAARVLLVEDNPDTAEALTMLLELLGHQVRSVYDGLAAMGVVRAQPPDVMLVDIGLPGMDGYEVARRVRRDPELKQVVLVALTGYGRDEDKQRAMAAGFDYHLVKPVNPDALHGLVSRLGKREPAKAPTVH